MQLENKTGDTRKRKRTLSTFIIKGLYTSINNGIYK